MASPLPPVFGETPQQRNARLAAAYAVQARIEAERRAEEEARRAEEEARALQMMRNAVAASSGGMFGARSPIALPMPDVGSVLPGIGSALGDIGRPPPQQIDPGFEIGLRQPEMPRQPLPAEMLTPVVPMPEMPERRQQLAPPPLPLPPEPQVHYDPYLPVTPPMPMGFGETTAAYGATLNDQVKAGRMSIAEAQAAHNAFVNQQMAVRTAADAARAPTPAMPMPVGEVPADALVKRAQLPTPAAPTPVGAFKLGGLAARPAKRKC